MSSSAKILRLLRKDILLEIRQQYALYGILLYVASTIFVLYMAMGRPEADVWNGLFWMIQLFICVNAVAKSFLQDSRERMLYFYNIAGPVDFILSKLLYNLLLMLTMSLLSLLVFTLLLGAPMMRPGLFLGITCLGGISLSLVFTLLAAIASKARQQAALLAILGFPLIIPQIMLLVRLSRDAFGEVFRAGAVWKITALLVGFDGMVVLLSIILFPFLWKD
ncbi:heme exporter protein CcmB [Dinghuibacter silviterrae]|uniref:Heme exporter protein B n=1 Tax=Dinghuibacter silviterrae TaxID=1539049 RepID=A0A4V3GKI5_9BACT|nr:heme exporter protein CcmB [Dinghuibacter silviterrae]TDW95792.1 heme exporter protein B [Dinghuibacter silviterrae]